MLLFSFYWLAVEGPSLNISKGPQLIFDATVPGWYVPKGTHLDTTSNKIKLLLIN